MAVANANKDSSESIIEGVKRTSDKGFITFVHNALEISGQTFSNLAAIKKGDQYYKGSRPKNQTTGRCNPIVCTMEESVDWVSGSSSNVESIVQSWNSKESKTKTSLDTNSYQIVATSGKQEISSIIGRAPDQVTFRKGETDPETLLTTYTIIEKYPSDMDTVNLNKPNPETGLIIEYKYAVDADDQVVYLISPNGVKTVFTYEEEEQT